MVIRTSRPLWRRWALLALLCVPSGAQAIWYEAIGYATITAMGIANAEDQALEQAISNALMMAGSPIPLEQVVKDGQVIASALAAATKGVVQSVEVIDNSRKRGQIEVRIRADILLPPKCRLDNYRKSMVVGGIELIRPQQAQVGGLYDLGAQITRRLENHFDRRKHLSVEQRLAAIPDVLIAEQSVDDAAMLAIGTQLAREYNAQFITFGYIRDLSLYDQVDDSGLQDVIERRRNFTLQLVVYDALAQRKVMERSFHKNAPWDLGTSPNLDTNSALFWRSQFGREVLRTVKDAADYVDLSLSCEKTLGEVVSTADGNIIMNLGHDHGVSRGDYFGIRNKVSFMDPQGRIQSFDKESTGVVLTVSAAGEDFALLEPMAPQMRADVRLHDLLVPNTSYQFEHHQNQLDSTAVTPPSR